MKIEQSPQKGFRPGRHFELEDETVDDPYHLRGKLVEPAVCGDCGALYHDGHWQWISAPANAHQTRCAACKRILEDFPAGRILLEGDFIIEHHDDVLSLIHNLEKRKKSEHPMQRIMSIKEEDGKIAIMTTDIHLARGIGDALQAAYKGDLTYHYNKAEYQLRVRWRR